MSSNRHHRVPRSKGGRGGHTKNVVKVNAEKHYHFHCLFGNMTIQQVIRELQEKWLDPSYTIILKKKAGFEWKTKSNVESVVSRLVSESESPRWSQS